MKKVIVTWLICAASSPLAWSSPTSGQVTRPPQYVVLAFDGSYSLPMWNETRQYARDQAALNKPLKFTYFINAAYYLSQSNRNVYNAPGAGPGRSAIGFGGAESDIIERFKQTNLARSEEHEIANHAAGHWDGSGWSQAQWHNEFDQFYKIIFGIFELNHVDPGLATQLNGLWKFVKKDMIGFRAPQLGTNSGMYAELPSWGIKYDTSGTAEPTLWPQRLPTGIWSFPLAVIEVAGTTRKTLSMDYNFYYFQSKAQPVSDPNLIKQYEDQMYLSYVNYFFGNYNGNRAPVNIGHHFSQWNDGAYWRAEKRFAELVCAMPEVKCVTYETLIAAIEQAESQGLLAHYRAGNFERTGVLKPVDAQLGRAVHPDMHPEADPARLLIADPAEAHEAEAQEKN